MISFPELDIFCEVVDNYGDIGFSYRLARSYKTQHPNTNVRLYIDTPLALQKIRLPHDDIGIYDFQSIPDKMAPLVVETFGCNIPGPHVEKMKTDTHLWINIEYLSAEPWTETCHGKESPQNTPGLKKVFYMPGFTATTGGVLTDFTARANPKNTVSIFTYNQDFETLFKACAELPAIQFLIFDQYAQKSLAASSCEYPQHSFVMSPFVNQTAYDQILADSLFNLVRGEESLIRAILAGKPFLWQAYPQENNYQLVKVQALLKTMEPFFIDKRIFDEYTKLLMAWNGDNKPVAVDNWRFLLENLSTLESYVRQFGLFLRRDCNLSTRFDQFIKQNW